jgi:hypothetical protein
MDTQELLQRHDPDAEVRNRVLQTLSNKGRLDNDTSRALVQVVSPDTTGEVLDTEAGALKDIFTHIGNGVSLKLSLTNEPSERVREVMDKGKFRGSKQGRDMLRKLGMDVKEPDEPEPPPEQRPTGTYGARVNQQTIGRLFDLLYQPATDESGGKMEELGGGIEICTSRAPALRNTEGHKLYTLSSLSNYKEDNSGNRIEFPRPKKLQIIDVVSVTDRARRPYYPPDTEATGEKPSLN